MTIKRYLCDRAVVGVMELTELLTNGPVIARFSETWFHPQGGGQKADRGKIGHATVIDVRNGDGVIDHYLDTSAGLEIGNAYPFTLDADWRLLSSRYHTGAHLLAGVVTQMFPDLSVVGGHQWPGEARVEFAGPHLQRLVELSELLEAAVRSEIIADLSVTIVDDKRVGRTCQIGAYAPIPCSGTHVRTTSDLGYFRLRSIKLKQDRARVGYEVVGPQTVNTNSIYRLGAT